MNTLIYSVHWNQFLQDKRQEFLAGFAAGPSQHLKVLGFNFQY